MNADDDPKEPNVNVEIKFRVNDDETQTFQVYSKSYANNDVRVRNKLQADDQSKWKHDHGELAELKYREPFLGIIMSLYEIKEISDNYLTSIISKQSSGKNQSSSKPGNVIEKVDNDMIIEERNNIETDVISDHKASPIKKSRMN